MTENEQTPAAHWEARYTADGKDQIWSGRVNTTVADVAATLTPGRSLDLGCGEGGDVVWLAEQGWQATGVDISPSAVARGRAAAAAAGVEAIFEATDLTEWRTQDEFDLVTATFFHSQVELERTRILRYAASRVAAGGHLLVVSHAGFPPWARAHDEEGHEGHRHSHDFLTPEQEIAELDLDAGSWRTVLAETRTRDAVGPDGEEAVLEDGVVLLRRTA
ncbi:methyltransferase domain-containing protein [Nocardioides sp. AE5]|uniref:class I SAM-dependent methyltransferase n=1 Tax=Nocardioides sp. AE5 TaxID=2962573 RepID=UPI0028822A71|nr:methyltransferase domain-containing protein [Nocardioides sp. AE5]MDT0203735.1 methyltransferase domain-containing protein [Nocardioides sp. AE5]